MVSKAAATIAVAIAAVIVAAALNLRKNIAKARKTGLKYIVLPVSPVNLIWQLTFYIWVPIIKLLPKSLWEGWLFVLLPDWPFKTGQVHFEATGAETFIAVSPYDMLLFTEDAEVIHQITQRREAFPKDVAMYGILAIFGANVLTTEGHEWRKHRKLTAASFNEKNAASTFSESIKQAQGLLSTWFGPEGEKLGTTKTISSLEHDSLVWALNIISYVGFGLRLLWPGQEVPQDVDSNMAKYTSFKPRAGHTLTFADSIAETLEKIVAIMLIPLPILKFLPIKHTRAAYGARVNYVQYMREFLQDKVKEAQEGNANKKGMDIMGSLVQSRYGTQKSKEYALTDDEIIGNAFIMFVAGHETSANVLHFALIMLAANPAAQRRLQQDVEKLFGDSDPNTWVYEQSINPMLASHIGACINETLRLMPPVANIPKAVTPLADQPITLKGETHILPAGLSLAILPVSVHRNPRFWPTKPSERTGAPTDLDDFLPDRWYRTRSAEGDIEVEVDDKGDYGGFQGRDTSDSLYRPIRGSYIPFSDGPRSCLGRRIAIVEITAIFAVLFQKYSIELAVDEWASDEEVARMSSAEKRAVYAKAQEKSQNVLKSATSLLTLKLHGGENVPVRLVKKGKERFINDLELV
ncbi:cytochrome P450 [Cladorrhinum samala]|uniref:Cytochrome P450 n=1 Tax=Cladorrhinum samala TaxID=585594 RepID=A0AAV9H6N6_9PEZI|nr:cytochrome P450 [Cladorrhinum samala]